MKAYRLCNHLVAALAVAFAGYILLLPADQLHMTLSLRGGRAVNPGRWLALLPLLIVVLNEGTWWWARKHPERQSSAGRDWGLLACEGALMGLYLLEQLHA